MAYHIIGDHDTVLGYRFAGVTGSVADTAEEAREAFRRVLADGGSRILLLTERVEALIEDQVVAHRLAATPPFLVIVPDLSGPLKGRKSLQDLIYEAVGIRIARDDEANGAS